MTSGPLVPNIIRYSIPIMISGLLQLMFNAADIAVVGRFTGSEALAAVSASGPVSNLLVTLFMGFSVGANVFCAQCAGAGDKDSFRKGVHTSMTFSVLAGFGLLIAGLAVSAPLLGVIKTPQEIMPLAKLYIRIFFFGVPATLVYNFGAAILRAVGETEKPLIYLTCAGVLNVILNLVFVALFHMGVAGVALATVLSQLLSAVLVVRTMMTTSEQYRLSVSGLGIDRRVLGRVLAIGVPAGIQSSSFSIANLLIQSAVNSFGPTVMAASTVAGSVDGICSVAIDAMAQSAISFAGQNYGAGNFPRIRKICVTATGLGCAVSLVIGVAMYGFSPVILRIFTEDPAVTGYAREIMFVVCVFSFINCLMSVPFNVVRGMNHSLFPMLSTLFCVCVLRVIWVYTIFARFRTVTMLYMAWPVTKGIAAVTGIAYYLWVMRKETRWLEEQTRAGYSEVAEE